MTEEGRSPDHQWPPLIIEAVLDRLPRDNTWDEYALGEWLEMLEGACRVHYRLPRRAVHPTPTGNPARADGCTCPPVDGNEPHLAGCPATPSGTPDRERLAAHFHAHPDGCNDLSHPSWRPTVGYKCERLAAGVHPAAPVHDHGPEEGEGTRCREYRIAGRLTGTCLLIAAGVHPAARIEGVTR